MYRKLKVYEMMETMMNPELRNRHMLVMSMPSINLIEPETLSTFLDTLLVVREF